VVALAVPVRRDAAEMTVGQRLGEGSLTVMRSAVSLGFAIMGISYATSLFHRIQLARVKHAQERTQWEAKRNHENSDRRKNMQGLDVILDIVEEYIKTIGSMRGDRTFILNQLQEKVHHVTEQLDS
jgi:hypothetical protein